MTKLRFAFVVRLSLIAVFLAGIFFRPQNVYAASLPAEINKQFTPLQIPAGGVSVLRVTVFNPNTFPLTNASWTDDLIGVQPGLFIANPANVVNTCGVVGDVTAVPGTTTLSLANGTVPAQVGSTPGQCYVEINVSSVTPGNLINTIPSNNLSSQGNDGGTPVSITNLTPASATITVIAVSPPSLSKSFSPNTIFMGQTSTLTIRLNNNDANYNLTGATYTDTLPTGLVVASPNGLTLTNCGPGTATATSGGTTISLSGATVTPALDCIVSVNVTNATGSYGAYTNTIPAGPGGPGSLRTDQGVTNNSPASAPLNVQPVAIAKSFSPSTIDAGDVSNLTITFYNPTGSPYTGVAITDSLPANLTIDAAPITNTCGFTANHVIGDTLIDVSGGTIPASLTPPTPVGTCVLTIPVRASVASSGSRTNTIPANTLTANQPVTNYLPATANLTIQQALYGTKAYSPTFINTGGTSQVTITLHNRASIPLTGVTFTDTLPAGLTVSGTPAAAQCSGTVTNTVNSVTLTGGTIPADGSCTIVFNVTSVTPGVYDNTVAANTIATNQGVGHAAFSTNPDLTVIDPSDLPPVQIGKAFNTNPISPGQTSRLRITITAPVDTSISGINITDTLPPGLVIANPPAPAETCPGGTLIAVNGTNTITFTNLPGNTLAAGASCNIDVWVTSTTPGLYTNTIPANAITTNQGRTNTNPATASIRVTSLNVSKAFYPTRVQAGGRSVMTITLENTTDSMLTNVSLLDTLPGTVNNGIRVAAPSNASTTCGAGTVTATPGSNQVILSNGSVPAQVGNVPGVCTITVDVVGSDSTPNTPSQQTNTIPVANVSATVANTGVTIQPRANASAILYIENMSIGIVKGFNPVLVYGGASSVMSVQLINPNANTALTGIAFTDNMDPGMHLTDPVVFNTGTCGGALSGNPGDSAFSFSGGVLPPNSTCTLTVRVVMSVNANRTNTIPAGAVTTFNGVTNPDPTAASLTNLPGVSVTKGFNPSSVSINQPSTLTITIKNTSTIPVVNMGLTDGLPGTLPDGLEVANPASATNTCGGSLTANPGDQNITLTGGGLAGLGDPGDTCVITVQVLSTRPGSYLNIIPGGAITSDGGITNNDPTDDTLDVVAYYSLGNRVWFDTNNNSLLDGTEVGADGVTVQLYAADGSGNPTGAVLASQVTANGGYYRFDNLPEGDYVVVIPANQFDGGPLTGYWSSGTTLTGAGNVTETAAPDPDNDVDNDDNGTLQTSGAFSGAVISKAVTLGPSASEPTGETDADPTNPAGEAPDAFSNRTVDFGFYRQTLGDQVFVDVDGNGAFNSGDTPLPGATVQLFAADGVTEILVGPDGILGTADDGPGGVTTGASGTYLFSGLPQGNYIVRVTPPSGYSSTVDSADSVDTGNPNTNTDDNDNGVGTASGAASSAVVTLTPGSAGAQNNNTVVNASGSTANPTVDFGFIIPVYSLGNRVWFDTNNNSLLDGTEVGADGVTVQLYAADGSGNPTGAVLASQVTANGGYYRFDNLPEGDYVVVIPANQFDGGPLTGYWSSGTTLTGAGNVTETAAPDPDNDVDNDDNGTLQTSGAFSGAVISKAVTLGPSASEPTGETDADPTNPAGEAPDAFSNRTVDFGFYRVELGNQVFVDVDGNGAFNSGDTPLPGATVQLFAADGVTEILVGPDGILGTADDGPGGVTTGASGTYLFSGLPQGNYIVRVTPPAGYISTVDTFNSGDTGNANLNIDHNDNGIGTALGQVSSSVVTLTPGSTGAATNNTVTNTSGTTYNPTVDFGFLDTTGDFSKSLAATSAAHTSGNDLTIGEIATFGLHVTLPEGVIASATVIDDLPAGLEYISGSAQLVTTAAGCGALTTDFNGLFTAGDPVITAPGGSGGNVTFQFSNITVIVDGDTANNTFVICFDAVLLDEAGNQNGGALTNNASLQIGAGSRITDSTDVNIVEPELEIIKAVSTATPFIGQTFTYTLTIQHLTASTADAFDLTVSDSLPTNLNRVSGPTYSDAPASCAGTVTDNTSGDNINLTVASLPLGCVLTVTYDVQINAAASPGDTFLNTATVTWTSLNGVDTHERTGAGGVDDYTDSARETVTYTAVDLQISKDDGGITTVAGGLVIYTLNYGNVGSSVATGVVISETVPANAAFNAANSAAGWSCADGSPAGTTCTLTLGTLNPGDSGSAAFAVTVADPLPAGVTQIDNTTSITDDGTHGTDANPTDNTDDDSTPVDAAPDLTVTKDDGLTVVSPGQTITYTLTIRNVGTQNATGVTVTDTLPANTTFVSASNGGTEAGGVVTWPTFDLAAGASVTRTLTIQVDNPFPGTSILNRVHVEDDGSNGTDPTPGNNDDDDIDSVLSGFSKSLIATNQGFTPDPSVAIGEIVTYEVAFTVPAGGTLPSLTLTDTLDRGLAFVDCLSVTASDPSIDTTLVGGFTSACVAGANPKVQTEPIGSKNPADKGRRVIFTLGDVGNTGAANGTIAIRYTAVVLDSLENQEGLLLTNSAALTWATGTLTASAPNIVIVEPDFDLFKDADRTIALPGSTITFTLTFSHTNLSSVDAFDVVLMDILPSSLEYVPGSLRVVRGPAGGVPNDSAAPTLSVSWPAFPLMTGGHRTTAVVEFQAKLGNLLPGQTAKNTAALAWTSLPGLVQNPQSLFNPLSTERFYDPGSAVNVYGVFANVTVTVPRLPSTGFAPGVITSIPSQPANKAYTNLGDFWLEIPSLGVQIPIVGIPAKGDEWDLTWLWGQAGWLEGTAYPTHKGNSALTAHVNLSDGQKGPFSDLYKLRWGDRIIVHLGGQRYIYEVRQTRQVSPYAISVLKHQELPYLTLITCREYDEASGTYRYRVAVEAVLISVEN